MNIMYDDIVKYWNLLTNFILHIYLGYSSTRLQICHSNFDILKTLPYIVKHNDLKCVISFKIHGIWIMELALKCGYEFTTRNKNLI
jgi:hypothetical protein